MQNKSSCCGNKKGDDTKKIEIESYSSCREDLW
jgi:hypothetical protein